jgi:hypothetical protein
MRPSTREPILTVDDAVRAGARVADPEERSEGVTALIESFEDDDRPATAAEDLRGELESTVEEIDPGGRDPQVAIAAATASWLATKPDDVEDRDRAIREGVRSFYGDGVSEPVADWLTDHGLE